jgi:hypothetical protein
MVHIKIKRFQTQKLSDPVTHLVMLELPGYMTQLLFRSTQSLTIPVHQRYRRLKKFIL